HGMVAIFFRRKRIDVKRHVKSRDGAVSKTINGVNDGKCQAVGGEAVEKIAYSHDQNRYGNKQPRAAWIVGHADRQPRYQRENRMDLKRSWMFVPGHRQRMIDKALVLNADAIMLDIEDGVAPNEKDTARHLIGEALGQAKAPNSPARFVRINAIGHARMDADL